MANLTWAKLSRNGFQQCESESGAAEEADLTESNFHQKLSESGGFTLGKNRQSQIQGCQAQRSAFYRRRHYRRFSIPLIWHGRISPAILEIIQFQLKHESQYGKVQRSGSEPQQIRRCESDMGGYEQKPICTNRICRLQSWSRQTFREADLRSSELNQRRHWQVQSETNQIGRRRR